MEKPNTSKEREATFKSAIYHLRHNPAYLTLFALGLAGGGVVITAFVRSSDTSVAIVATVSWIIFLIASLLVVAFVESRRSTGQLSLNISLDEKALKSFFESQSAERLSGRWNVFWYEGFGSERKAYTPDPHEIADISTNGSQIFIHSYDESMASSEEDYWFIGRISEKSDVSLIYWGPSKGSTKLLTGVAFLEVDDTFEGKGDVMTGWWRGRTRDEEVTTGAVEFIRFGRKTNNQPNEGISK